MSATHKKKKTWIFGRERCYLSEKDYVNDSHIYVPEIFQYIIHKNERGEFFATVESEETTLLTIKSNDDGEIDMIVDGFISSIDDVSGIKNHLLDLNIIYPEDIVEKA